jgi:hypothetical protein
MTISRHYLILTLWILVIVAESGVSILLLRRRAWNEHIAFLAFIVFCTLRSYLLFYQLVVIGHSSGYPALRSLVYLAQGPLLIAVVLEVVRNVFRPFESLPRGVLGSLVLAMCTVAFLAALFAIFEAHGNLRDWLSFFSLLDHGCTIALLGIFGVFTCFASTLGIPWGHRIVGIILGFSFYVCVDVVVESAALSRPMMKSSVWPIEMVAFLVSCMVWFWYFVPIVGATRKPTREDVRAISLVLADYVFSIKLLEKNSKIHHTLRLRDEWHAREKPQHTLR